MTKEQKDLSVIAPRPDSPGVKTSNDGGLQPWQTDPDLAAMEIARVLINKFPVPSVVSDKFVVRHGIFKALNHRDPVYDAKTGICIDPGNPTGLNCNLRVHLYDSVANESVNIEGRLFNSVFAFLMKPKYIIQGQIGQPVEKEEKQSIAGRIFGALTGKKKQQDNQQGQ